MPVCILLSSLPDEGRKTVKSKTERIKKGNREIAEMAAKVCRQFTKTEKVFPVPR